MQRYSFPTAIVLGVNARAELLTHLKQANALRPLVVTDRGVAQLPFFADFVQLLTDGGLSPHSYTEVFGNPVKSQVTNGVTAYRDNQCNGIIGIGGGAAMDVAKTIALMVNHPGDVFDYEDGKPDALPVTEPIPYLAMVPTTAGTGSEVGRASVVSDDETKAKKIIFDPTLMPKVAILDPELLEKLPPSITATTGLDALCHLVEAYLAKGEHPMCDGIALEGIRIIKEALVECVGFAAKACGQEADYPQAIAVIQDDSRERHMRIRERMLQAAMMGAVAFQKGLGTTHSIAHALSTVNDLHHGLANGILMPHVMRYNAQEVPERFVTMAQAAGLDPTPESFINWLVELQTTLNVPGYLAPAGVTEDHLESIADYAFADGCHQSNPRDCTRDDLLAITRAALSA